MVTLKPKNETAIFSAILAALLFGISSPFSKILLVEIPPALMAALLYLGAGIGISLLNFIWKIKSKDQKEAKITRSDLPFVLGMIALDIAAPICLMMGLTMTTSANVALLNNFEIVATSLIALFIFKEAIGKRLWIAIGLITFSSLILSVEDLINFSFSLGAVYVLLACLCWGFENNCTRRLSIKNPMQVVIIKGFGSGFGSILIAISLREYTVSITYLLAALVLGFFSYGLSIFFYVSAQRELGAARTSTYYAIAPFVGVGLSFLIFQEIPTLSFLIALFIMIAGTYFASCEQHKHLHEHTSVTHEHRHYHKDWHHNHEHDEPVKGDHSHRHTHKALVHVHRHTPDIYHFHMH